MKLVIHWTHTALSVNSFIFFRGNFPIPVFWITLLALLSHYLALTKPSNCFITVESENMCREEIYIITRAICQINGTPILWFYNQYYADTKWIFRLFVTCNPSKISCFLLKIFFQNILCGFSVLPLSKSGLWRLIWDFQILSSHHYTKTDHWNGTRSILMNSKKFLHSVNRSFFHVTQPLRNTYPWASLRFRPYRKTYIYPSPFTQGRRW